MLISPLAPIPNSYGVPFARLTAGEYPGSAPHVAPNIATAKLTAFLNAGVTAFIDLTEPVDGLTPYMPALLALADARGVSVTHVPMRIRDMGVPASTATWTFRSASRSAKRDTTSRLHLPRPEAFCESS